MTRHTAQLIADLEVGEIFVVLPAADGRGEIVLAAIKIKALTKSEKDLLPLRPGR